MCPMTCPKGLRNGLCGGASPEHCEVDPSRPCTWYKIYERAERMGRVDRLLEINAPIDGAKAGRETWLEALRTWRRERSRADGVPAYVVASDATLRAIAERAPADRGTLARVPGIGPAKLDRYGDEILALVGDTAPMPDEVSDR